MISRTWHGLVPRDKRDAFEQYEYETGIKDTTSLKGNCGAYLKIVDQDEYSHFFLCTKWDTMESMVAYEGDNPRVAVTYTKDEEFGLISDPIVDIQEVNDKCNPFSF